MIYLGFQDYFQFALQGIIILIAVFITVTDFGPARKSLQKSLRSREDDVRGTGNHDGQHAGRRAP